MWKWLGGCLLVCVAVIGIGVWSAYRKLAPFSGTNRPESMMIGAPPSRVFASLANVDSLSGWMGGRVGVTVGHHGWLVPGDTLRIGRGTRFMLNGRLMLWTVREVRPDQLLALQLKSDSTGAIAASRDLTLTAKGESTLVVSAVSAPLLGLMKPRNPDSVKASDALLVGASKVFMSSLRFQAHTELQRLKARVEGHPIPTGQR